MTALVLAFTSGRGGGGSVFLVIIVYPSIAETHPVVPVFSDSCRRRSRLAKVWLLQSTSAGATAAERWQPWSASLPLRPGPPWPTSSTLSPGFPDLSPKGRLLFPPWRVGAAQQGHRQHPTPLVTSPPRPVPMEQHALFATTTTTSKIREGEGKKKVTASFGLLCQKHTWGCTSRNN